MLYILRHGKTDWNNEHRLQGKTDIPLNEEGRAMAEKAAKEYEAVHFDVCFCSPLIRARETAKILLEGRNVPVIIDDRLAEMGFGVYEGVRDSFNIPDSDCPVNVLFKEPEKYVEPVEGGESLEELFDRTGQFLEEKVFPLVKSGKDVIIVGHGAMNSSIICRVMNKDIKDFWSAGIENCKLMRLI